MALIAAGIVAFALILQLLNNVVHILSIVIAFVGLGAAGIPAILEVCIFLVTVVLVGESA